MCTQSKETQKKSKNEMEKKSTNFIANGEFQTEMKALIKLTELYNMQ